jgi:hypothetical protein
MIYESFELNTAILMIYGFLKAYLPVTKLFEHNSEKLFDLA